MTMNLPDLSSLASQYGPYALALGGGALLQKLTGVLDLFLSLFAKKGVMDDVMKLVNDLKTKQDAMSDLLQLLHDLRAQQAAALAAQAPKP